MSNEEEKIDPEIIDKLKDIESMTEDQFKTWIRNEDLEVPESENIKKLIDCQHEIIFSIIANVLSQNEKGEIVGVKEVCKKNFHIPVPIDKDYKDYMNRFFEYLESNILQTIRETNNDTKDKNE